MLWKTIYLNEATKDIDVVFIYIPVVLFQVFLFFRVLFLFIKPLIEIILEVLFICFEITATI